MRPQTTFPHQVEYLADALGHLDGHCLIAFAANQTGTDREEVVLERRHTELNLALEILCRDF
ncbi:MAG TPA: hypothetical protein VF614_09895 [Chthoniobacteraceae bacterium]